MDHRKQRSAERSQNDADHEIAHNKRPRHGRNAGYAPRNNQAIRSFEKPEKASVNVVAPTQHKVDQERYE